MRKPQNVYKWKVSLIHNFSPFCLENRGKLKRKLGWLGTINCYHRLTSMICRLTEKHLYLSIYFFKVVIFGVIHPCFIFSLFVWLSVSHLLAWRIITWCMIGSKLLSCLGSSTQCPDWTTLTHLNPQNASPCYMCLLKRVYTVIHLPTLINNLNVHLCDTKFSHILSPL